jgi:NAD(P)-dependent dehydrogenase (short-subunit alcohol dehydrogenase family)
MGRYEQPRVVVITGASSGIGRAAAHAFARLGAAVGLMARGSEGLQAAAREVEQLGGRALVLCADVTDAEQVEAAAGNVEHQFGPIDCWVNAAVVTVMAPVKQMSAREFHAAAGLAFAASAWMWPRVAAHCSAMWRRYARGLNPVLRLKRRVK